jgi:hypothetical protein
MTTLSLLGGTWSYEFEDEFVAGGSNRTGTRMLRYVSGGVVTGNALYSALAEAADDFQAMGFKNPMLPVTPNQYTMENQAFISRASTEFIKEATIVADWSMAGTAGDTAGHGVLRVEYTESVAFVPGDIGREVVEATSGDSGTLLDYEVEPDGTTILWIRPSDATPVTGDTWELTTAISTTGGTGAASGHVAVTVFGGICRYTAIQAIGSVPAATDVYIVQNRIKLANSTDNTGFQFWSTDETVSLGIISVLIRTMIDGVAIQAQDLEVFARKYGALYDNFRLNVAAGGFSALPLASAPDINNTTGYRTTGTLTGVGGTWTVGNGVYQGGTWATATARGVITETNTNTELEYYLVGDLTDLANTTAIKEYDFVAQADGDATGTTATVGVNLGGPTDTTSGEGGNVTITIGHVTVDHDNTGTAEPYSIQVDSQNNIAIAKVYERLKYVARQGSDNTFWDTVSCSVPGEQYRGVEALYYFDATTATMVEGEDIVNETKTGLTARLLALNDPFAGEDVGQDYITVTDLQPSTLSTANDDVWADSTSTNDITVDTAGAGGAIVTHASVKASPFGSFTGTQIFGAPGVSFINPGAGDAQSYILTDDLGTLRSPPNTITYTVANTRVGDHIYVARDTGTDGVINKDQFGGMTAVAASSKTITVAGSIDGEVPTAGYVRVVETTLQEEHKYEYSSRTTGASGVFSLTDITAASATAGTGSTALSKTGGPSFITEGVKPGMLVQDTTNTGTYEVVSVTDADNLVIKHLYGADLFASGDAYTINETIQLYATSDDIYDLIIDAEEDVGTDGTPGSISNTLIKVPAANFGTVAQGRLGKTILPFELNQDQGDGNTTVTTVRQPDTIAT